MRSPGRDRRFFASTRGRIIKLLRRASRTVDELASELGLTDNAVRAHLVVLERDGLVQHQGRRPSGGKPATIYRLTPEAEALFPRAYAQILCLVLDTVSERHGDAEMEAMLRVAGQALANAVDRRVEGETPEDRLQLAKRIWADLGGLADVRSEGSRRVLEELSCPLREIVLAYPAGCQLAQALLESLLDTAVGFEHYVRDVEPRCRFEVAVGRRPAVTECADGNA